MLHSRGLSTKEVKLPGSTSASILTAAFASESLDLHPSTLPSSTDGKKAGRAAAAPLSLKERIAAMRQAKVKPLLPSSPTLEQNVKTPTIKSVKNASPLKSKIDLEQDTLLKSSALQQLAEPKSNKGKSLNNKKTLRQNDDKTKRAKSKKSSAILDELSDKDDRRQEVEAKHQLDSSRADPVETHSSSSYSQTFQKESELENVQRDGINFSNSLSKLKSSLTHLKQSKANPPKSRRRLQPAGKSKQKTNQNKLNIQKLSKERNIPHQWKQEKEHETNQTSAYSHKSFSKSKNMRDLKKEVATDRMDKISSPAVTTTDAELMLKAFEGHSVCREGTVVIQKSSIKSIIKKCENNIKPGVSCVPLYMDLHGMGGVMGQLCLSPSSQYGPVINNRGFVSCLVMSCEKKCVIFNCSTYKEPRNCQEGTQLLISPSEIYTFTNDSQTKSCTVLLIACEKIEATSNIDIEPSLNQCPPDTFERNLSASRSHNVYNPSTSELQDMDFDQLDSQFALGRNWSNSESSDVATDMKKKTNSTRHEKKGKRLASTKWTL